MNASEPTILHKNKKMGQYPPPELRNNVAKVGYKWSGLMVLVTRSNYFNQTILGVIIVAAILVGLQSYESLADNPVVVAVDAVVLSIFTFEVVAKILAEGRRPWVYFTGCERNWNIFDFVIVLFCMPFIPINGGSVAFLRLMRLMRVTKLFKRIPELQVIVTGMVLGLKSIIYILLLLLLVFYLFAVFAVFTFRDNDPGNFGDLSMAFLTLFRCATLEDWTDIMYTNMLGCDNYNMGLYFPANTTKTFSTQIGRYFEFTCVSPNGQWAVSVVYFVLFTVISSFVVLSLFIGAITLSMSEVLDKQMRERKHANIISTVNPEWLWDVIGKALQDKPLDSSIPMTTWKPKKPFLSKGRKNGLLSRSMSSLASLLDAHNLPDVQDITPLLAYLYWALLCRKLVRSSQFEGFMLLTIITAGILVGVSTVLEEGDCSLCIADDVILGIFTFELVVKLFSEGKKPYRFFWDPWNRFDFLIVVASYLPRIFSAESIGSMISIFRLLRILRVLKLVSKFKRLKIVVEALLKGFNSISYISVMMLVLFYMFAIVGMILFQANDPWHFGLLQDAMLTLFRCATLEDWTDVMYINMWGCDRYGYGNFPELCRTPIAWGWLATLYFMVFAVMGSMVLVTLFLGVVTTSMEQASLRQKMEDKLQDAIEEARAKHKITDHGVRMLYNAFTLLDEDDGGTLEYDEIKPLMASVSSSFTDFNFQSIFRCVDTDRSGSIDFAEFIHLMVLIQKWAEDNGIRRNRQSNLGRALQSAYRRVSSRLLNINGRRPGMIALPHNSQQVGLHALHSISSNSQLRSKEEILNDNEKDSEWLNAYAPAVDGSSVDLLGDPFESEAKIVDLESDYETVKPDPLSRRPIQLIVGTPKKDMEAEHNSTSSTIPLHLVVPSPGTLSSVGLFAQHARRLSRSMTSISTNELEEECKETNFGPECQELKKLTQKNSELIEQLDILGEIFVHLQNQQIEMAAKVKLGDKQENTPQGKDLTKTKLKAAPNPISKLINSVIHGGNQKRGALGPMLLVRPASKHKVHCDMGEEKFASIDGALSSPLHQLKKILHKLSLSPPISKTHSMIDDWNSDENAGINKRISPVYPIEKPRQNTSGTAFMASDNYEDSERSLRCHHTYLEKL